MKIFLSLASSNPNDKYIRAAKGPKADKLREQKKVLSPKLRGANKRLETANKNKDRKAVKTILKERMKLSDQINKIEEALVDIGRDQKNGPMIAKIKEKAAKREAQKANAKPKSKKAALKDRIKDAESALQYNKKKLDGAKPGTETHSKAKNRVARLSAKISELKEELSSL